MHNLHAPPFHLLFGGAHEGKNNFQWRLQACPGLLRNKLFVKFLPGPTLQAAAGEGAQLDTSDNEATAVFMSTPIIQIRSQHF